MKDSRKKKTKEKKIIPLVEEIKDHKLTFAVYAVLRIIVIGFIVLSILRENWENVFTCVLTLVLLLIPMIVERKFRVELPTVLEVIVLLFFFAAEILGELRCFYIRYPGWDTMLHTVNGFIFAAAGFALVDVLNRNDRIKFKLTPAYLALVAFCFSMAVGVLWEFFEYGADLIFNTDMQKDTVIGTISSVMLDPTDSNKAVVIDGITSTMVNGTTLPVTGYLDIGLHDTMKDLFVNFIGATVFSIIGFVYVKTSGEKRTIAEHFIPKIKKDKNTPSSKK